MSAPNQEIYLLIMTCTTTEEIVAAINKFQAMSYFLKSSTPGLNLPTTQSTNYAVAAQQAKSVSFTSDTQNNIPGWAQNLENKLSDQMTKLAKSINKLTHDRRRNDTYDDRYDDSYHYNYDDRHDGHKPRYCDGHREERDRDYEDYGTYRKRYRSPCRHDPRKSERYPNCPESQIEEQMDEIVQSSVNILKNVNKLLNKKRKNCVLKDFCKLLLSNSNSLIRISLQSMLIILHVVTYFHVVIFQMMSQSTSFLMRKYRTCSLIIIRKKHSLRETVRWAQKTLFRVKLAHLMGQSSNLKLMYR